MPLGFILIFAVVAVGMLVTILAKLISSLSQKRPKRPWTNRPPANLMTSMADDGFWISSDQVSPATMIQYYYWVQGVQRIGQVPFQPGPDGRQFIYTGERPDSVSVLLADAASPPDIENVSHAPSISTWS